MLQRRPKHHTLPPTSSIPLDRWHRPNFRRWATHPKVSTRTNTSTNNNFTSNPILCRHSNNSTHNITGVTRRPPLSTLTHRSLSSSNRCPLTLWLLRNTQMPRELTGGPSLSKNKRLPNSLKRICLGFKPVQERRTLTTVLVNAKIFWKCHLCKLAPIAQFKLSNHFNTSNC